MSQPVHASLGIVALCLSELIKNQAVSTAIGALLSIGVAVLITRKLNEFYQIPDFSFTSLLITATKDYLPAAFDKGAYGQAFTLGCVYIILAAGISILSMKKRDL